MAIEYVIFDRKLCDRFVRLIAARGITADVRPDTIEGFSVAIPDTLSEELEEAIEAEYESLMIEQRDLVESMDTDSARSLMAVTVTLLGGEPCVVPIRAELGRRLYEHFTIEEVQDLVSEIAAAVTNPVRGPLCRR